MDSRTIDYYNSNADAYFESTVGADMAALRERFLKLVQPSGRIIDVGAGSGRDLKYFLDAGFDAEGIDLSCELCKKAEAYSGAKVMCADVCEWQPDKKYDGVWANASLLHLPASEIENFVLRLPLILKNGGVAFISMKSGIADGYDDKGRFFTNFTEEMMHGILEKSDSLELVDCWRTGDELQRGGFEWVNFLIRNCRKG